MFSSHILPFKAKKAPIFRLFCSYKKDTFAPLFTIISCKTNNFEMLRKIYLINIRLQKLSQKPFPNTKMPKPAKRQTFFPKFAV